jgi:hypothetical protein
MAEEEELPTIIMLPEAQREIDANPELAKAMPGLAESLKNALQGVKDGRYKSFEDAMQAMTGERPRQIDPPHPPKHGYYLSTMPAKDGDGLIAVITDGHPQKGDKDIEVLDVNRCATQAAARVWYQDRCPMLPWEDRNSEPVRT